MGTFTAIMAGITTVLGVIKDVTKAAWPVIKILLIIMLILFGVVAVLAIPAFMTTGFIKSDWVSVV